MELSKLKTKIKRFFKATISVVPSYYTDYENAYLEGYDEGYGEGQKDGWSDAKTEGKVAWNELYGFLQARKYIEPREEITTFEMVEQLLRFEYDMKQDIKFWKEKYEATENR